MRYVIVDRTNPNWLYLYKFDEETGEPIFDKILCRTYSQDIAKKAYFNAQRHVAVELAIFPMAKEAIVFQQPGEQGCFLEQKETNNGSSQAT